LARASEKKPKKKKVRPKGAKNKPRAKAPKKEVKKEKPKIKSKEKAERELISASEAVVKEADTKPTSIAAVKASKSALTAADTAAKAEAEARTALERSEAAKKAVEAAAEEEYKAAAAEVVIADAGRGLTNKRGAERIFRREMGEPEFWQEKNERAPLTPVLSQTQEEQISRQVQIPQDQTPEYNPQHILSPEFAGVSSYEREIKNQREELEQRLIRLKNDPNASNQEIKLVEEDLKTLDYLFENYYIGMNVFRTAKGGRNKLRV
jgi:colicin import membrane protein